MVSDRAMRLGRVGATTAWGVPLLIACAAIVLAVFSPFLAYRTPAYIVGGFAGIICLALLLFQPLLAAGYLPGLGPRSARRWHMWLGWGIIGGVVLHVGGLFVTSPPDTLDALMLVSPTPFSVYGVTAMWGIVITGILVGMRRKLRLRYPTWRLVHNGIALIVIISTVIHAVQIEGAMEPVSKWVLCIAVLIVTTATLFDLRVRKPMLQWREARRARKTGRA